MNKQTRPSLEPLSPLTRSVLITITVLGVVIFVRDSFNDPDWSEALGGAVAGPFIPLFWGAVLPRIYRKIANKNTPMHSKTDQMTMVWATIGALMIIDAMGSLV